MKKATGFSLIVAIITIMIFLGCQTRSTTYEQNGINLFPSFSLEKLSSDDYTVIETIRGRSEITITKDNISGDTRKYGILNDALNSKNILELVTNEKWRLENPEEIARLNANYVLIHTADALNADALWMPRSSKEIIIEKNKTIIRITVTAKAVQILNQ